MKILSDWDITDFEHATQHAKELTESTNIHYIPVDRGPHTAPQFSITVVPQIGDEVSYAFNGDSRPYGTITKVSKTLKVITTSTGKKYYRKNLTSTWKYAKTWSLVNGHHDERNPHF